MKKHLLALAALATVSGAAFAQSSVTVYGFLDAGILSTNNSTGGKSATMMTGGQFFPSMLGFTGSEDLGGGLKANFNLQSSLFNASGSAGLTTSNASSATAFFDRYATVGLSGSYGKVDLGRQIDIMFLQSFVNGVVATHTNSLAVHGLLTYGTMGTGQTNLSTQGAFVNNAIGYVSPSFNGLKLQAQTSLGGQAGDASKMATSAGILTYDAGLLNLSAGYEVQNDNVGGTALKKSLVGAKYNLNGVLLAGQYHTYKYGSGTTVSATQGGAQVDVKAYELGVGYQVTPKTLVAVNYEHFDNNLANTTPTILSLKAKYDLSKRTYLYGTAARFNKDAGGIMQGYNNTSGVTTKSTSNLGVGVVHSF